MVIFYCYLQPILRVMPSTPFWRSFLWLISSETYSARPYDPSVLYFICSIFIQLVRGCMILPNRRMFHPLYPRVHNCCRCPQFPYWQTLFKEELCLTENSLDVGWRHWWPWCRVFCHRENRQGARSFSEVKFFLGKILLSRKNLVIGDVTHGDDVTFRAGQLWP